VPHQEAEPANFVCSDALAVAVGEACSALEVVACSVADAPGICLSPSDSAQSLVEALSELEACPTTTPNGPLPPSALS
jgi:hypothetical protein